MYLTANLLNVVATCAPGQSFGLANIQAGLGDLDLWKIAFILLVGVLVLGASLLAYRLFNRASRANAAFLSQAVRIGLTREEQDVLRLVAQLAELRNIQSIFTLEEVFHTGSHHVLQSARVKAMTPEGQQYIASLLNMVREKLGFHAGEGEVRITTTRQIPEGSKLYITHRSRMESFDAIVEKCSLMHLELRPAMPVDAEESDRWQARFCDGSSIWEFDVISLRPEGSLLLMEHTQDIRFVNRRRFPRVPVDQPAFLAAFSFDKPNVSSPEFVPARLVELAGAGMRVRAPLSIEAGQRALIVTQFADGRTIQAMGKVRRANAQGPGEFDLAIELVSLTSPEIDVLAQQTAQAEQLHVKPTPSAADAPSDQPARELRVLEKV